MDEIPEELLSGTAPVRRSSLRDSFGSFSGGSGSGGSSRSFFKEMPYGNGGTASLPSGGFIPQRKKIPAQPRAEVKLTKYMDREKKKPDYEVGDRVKHIKFGVGTVEALEEGTRDYQVTVDFDGVGRKIMYADFAKLERV